MFLSDRPCTWASLHDDQIILLCIWYWELSRQYTGCRLDSCCVSICIPFRTLYSTCELCTFHLESKALKGLLVLWHCARIGRSQVSEIIFQSSNVVEILQLQYWFMLKSSSMTNPLWVWSCIPCNHCTFWHETYIHTVWAGGTGGPKQGGGIRATQMNLYSLHFGVVTITTFLKALNSDMLL